MEKSLKDAEMCPVIQIREFILEAHHKLIDVDLLKLL